MEAHDQIVRWIERTVLLCAILFFALHSLPRAWRPLNTDFPNYYLAARLAHEGYDTSRMYEWQWIEREKDHRNMDDRVIGLLPITPFSTLAVYPLSGMAPLTAKHLWITLNIALLFPLAWILRRLAGLSYQRIAIVMLLCFPLHRNLLYGQFYILLLVLIAAACLSYLCGRRALSGSLIAIAAACKIFPLLFFVFFLLRRDWRALLSGVITLVATLALSVAVFGSNAHLVWLREIFPWVMRGEGLGTYAATASFSAILHRLFLAEPQWNPHPWHDSPFAYAMLSQILPMLALAPAILLIQRRDNRRSTVLLEWSAILTASLAVSTIPASYNFVLMVFPVCALAGILLTQRRYLWLGCALAAYLVIGYPLPVSDPQGLRILLEVPRLPCMLLMLTGIYGLLWRGGRERKDQGDWARYAWAAAMAIAVISGVRSTLRIETQQRSEYAYRLPLQSQGFLNEATEAADGGLVHLAFTLDGYRLVPRHQEPSSSAPSADVLSFTSGPSGEILMERADAAGSQIVDTRSPSNAIVKDARDPMLSPDGSDLAFLRDDHGAGQLMMRPQFRSRQDEKALTPKAWNVYEAAFRSAQEFAVSTTQEHGQPALMLLSSATAAPLELQQSRYPAFSPDGRWLAYSHLEDGVWNLWIRDLGNGASHRVADVPCNQISPSWEHDSQTLLYATDCGRSVWFTAIARRRVVPSS